MPGGGTFHPDEGTSLLRWILLFRNWSTSVGGACLVLYKGGGALVDKCSLSLEVTREEYYCCGEVRSALGCSAVEDGMVMDEWLSHRGSVLA